MSRTREPEATAGQPRQQIYLFCSPISASSGQVFTQAARVAAVFVMITGAGDRRLPGALPCQQPRERLLGSGYLLGASVLSPVKRDNKTHLRLT